MISKYTATFLLSLISSQVFAFQCYLTLVKDSCWTKYDVKVDVINADNNSLITTVEAPKGKSWNRQAFNCDPGMKLMYEASFEPSFWQNEQGKKYRAIRYWFLPKEVEAKQSAWDIPVCFSSAFSGVPFPPDAGGNCKCDFFSIPAVPLGKPSS